MRRHVCPRVDSGPKKEERDFFPTGKALQICLKARQYTGNFCCDFSGDFCCDFACKLLTIPRRNRAWNRSKNRQCKPGPKSRCPNYRWCHCASGASPQTPPKWSLHSLERESKNENAVYTFPIWLSQQKVTVKSYITYPHWLFFSRYVGADRPLTGIIAFHYTLYKAEKKVNSKKANDISSKRLRTFRILRYVQSRGSKMSKWEFYCHLPRGKYHPRVLSTFQCSKIGTPCLQSCALLSDGVKHNLGLFLEQGPAWRTNFSRRNRVQNVISQSQKQRNRSVLACPCYCF